MKKLLQFVFEQKQQESILINETANENVLQARLKVQFIKMWPEV